MVTITVSPANEMLLRASISMLERSAQSNCYLVISFEVPDDEMWLIDESGTFSVQMVEQKPMDVLDLLNGGSRR